MEKQHTENDLELERRKIMRMVIGYQISKTLFCANELRIFDKLANGPMTLDQIAQTTKLSTNTLERLLIALTSLNLIEKQGDSFSNTFGAQNFLVSTNPDFMGGILEYSDKDLYLLWNYLSDSVVEGTSRWKQAHGLETDSDHYEALYEDPVRVQASESAFNSMSVFTVSSLCKNFDFSSYKCLLDVGDGLGVLVSNVLKNNSHMRGILLDLPPVVPLAEKYIEEAGLKDRIEVKAGNMFESLPTGADIVALSWVLHNLSDQKSLDLLKKCYDVLPAGGTVILLEKLLNDNKTGPIVPALLSLTMLVASDGGKERTAKEYSQLLIQAGFVEPVVTLMPGSRDLIVAKKP